MAHLTNFETQAVRGIRALRAPDFMSTTTTSEYTIIKGKAELPELEKYRVCFRQNGTERSAENLYWLHLHNLPRKNSIYYAMQGDEIAAIYTALPVFFKINDQLVPALQSIDTLTDTHHRGKGLFIKLANRLFAEEVKNGFGLIYGFPNDNSAPGFFKKLGWKCFGEVPFLVKPINPMYFVKKFINRKKHTDFSSVDHVYAAPQLHRISANEEIRSIDKFDPAYDRIWKAASKNALVCVNRDSAYMNWRYVHKPGETYYRYGYYQNGELAGIIVFAIKHKHDGLIGYLMEILVDPATNNAGKQLMKFASSQFKSQKADLVLAWSIPGSMQHNVYKKGGYYILPEKLRPQKLFLGVKILDKNFERIAGDLKNWFISYSDSDTA